MAISVWSFSKTVTLNLSFYVLLKKTSPFPEEEKWKKKYLKQQIIIKYFEKAIFY